MLKINGQVVGGGTAERKSSPLKINGQIVQSNTGQRSRSTAPVATPTPTTAPAPQAPSKLRIASKFIRSLPSAATEGIRNLGQGIASGLGANDGLNEQLVKEAESRSDIVAATSRSNASRSRKAASLADLQASTSQNLDEINTIARQADVSRGLAALGEVTFDLATLGTGGAALKAGKAGGKGALKVAGKKIARGAAEGSAAGFFGGLQQDDASKESVLKSTLIGTAFGGGLSTLGASAPALNRAAKSVDGNLSAAGSRVAARLGDTSMGTRIADQASKFREYMVSDLEPITRSLKGIKDETYSIGKRTIDKGQVAKRKILRARNADAEAVQIVNTSLRNADSAVADQAVVKLGKTIRGASKDQLERGRAYSIARENLTGYDGGINPALGAKRIAELQDIVAKATPKDKELDKALQEFYQTLADRRLDAGLLDEASHKAFTSKDYVRIQREIAGETKGMGKGSASLKSVITDQKRTGGKAAEIDPIAVAMDYYVGTHGEILRNEAATYTQKALDEAGLLKATDTIKNAKIRKEARTFLSDTRGLKREIARVAKDERSKEMRIVRKGLKDAKADSVKVSDYLADPSSKADIINKISSQDPEFRRAYKSLLESTNEARAIDSARKSAFVQALNAKAKDLEKRAPSVGYYDQGVKLVGNVDERLGRAMGSMNAGSGGIWGRIAQVASIPGRVFRAGTTGLNPGFIIPNFVKDQIGAGVFSDKAGRQYSSIGASMIENLKSLGGKGKGELYDKYAVAFSSGKFEGKLSGDTQKAVNATLQQLGLKRNISVKAALEGTENALGKVSEEVTRYQSFRAMYKTLKKEGASENQALFWAEKAMRENSIDFRDAGILGREINKIFPYWNAATQGSTQLVRKFGEAPVKTSSRITAAVVAPVVGLTVYNMSDPERLQTYVNIPDYVKEGNYVLAMPGGKYFSLPKPPGVGDFSDPFRRFVEGLYGQDQPSFYEIARSMVDPFAGPADTDSVTSTLTPQFLKPAVQAKTNTDLFFGSNTDNFSDLQLPAAERFNDNTSGFAKTIGEKFNVSPKRVDKFIKDTFGELGSNVTGARDPLESISRRFTGSDVQQTVNNYYALRANVQLQVNSYKKRADAARDNGNFEEAKLIREESNAMVDRLFADFYEKQLPFVPEDELDKVNEGIESLKLSTDMKIIKRKRN